MVIQEITAKQEDIMLEEGRDNCDYEGKVCEDCGYWDRWTHFEDEDGRGIVCECGHEEALV